MLNRKGGVGKSAVALGLAASWAQRGRRILIVDLDPQGTATRSTDATAEADGGTDAALHGRPLDEAVQHLGPPWDLDVLGANQSLAGWDSDPNRLNREWRLRRALEGGGVAYDHIVIDCPPALGVLAVNALAASDHALLVTEATGAAVDGLGLAIQLFDEVREHMHEKLILAGVVVNAVDERERDSRHFLAEVRSVFAERCIEPPIPRRTAVRQAMSAHVPVHHLGTEGANQVVAAYNAISSRLEELS